MSKDKPRSRTLYLTDEAWAKITASAQLGKRTRSQQVEHLARQDLKRAGDAAQAPAR